jgi:hypothetical protein
MPSSARVMGLWYRSSSFSTSTVHDSSGLSSPCSRSSGACTCGAHKAGRGRAVQDVAMYMDVTIVEESMFPLGLDPWGFLMMSRLDMAQRLSRALGGH